MTPLSSPTSRRRLSSSTPPRRRRSAPAAHVGHDLVHGPGKPGPAPDRGCRSTAPKICGQDGTDVLRWRALSSQLTAPCGPMRSTNPNRALNTTTCAPNGPGDTELDLPKFPMTTTKRHTCGCDECCWDRRYQDRACIAESPNMVSVGTMCGYPVNNVLAGLPAFYFSARARYGIAVSRQN